MADRCNVYLFNTYIKNLGSNLGARVLWKVIPEGKSNEKFILVAAHATGEILSGCLLDMEYTDGEELVTW